MTSGINVPLVDFGEYKFTRCYWFLYFIKNFNMIDAISFYSDMPNLKYLLNVACQVSFDLDKYNLYDKIVTVNIIVFSSLDLIKTKEMLKNNVFDQRIKVYAKSEMEHLCINNCNFKWKFSYVSIIDLSNIVLQKFDYEMD